MSPLLGSLMGTVDEDDLPAEQQQCLMALREGKRLLKEKQGASAMVRFEKALMLAKSTGEMIYERRANRGLAAAAKLQVGVDPNKHTLLHMSAVKSLLEPFQ